MLGLIRDINKYKEYIAYYSLVLLRVKTVGSYLGVAWLIIEPFMFMLIYSFVVLFIFNSSYPNYHLFVFVGLIYWKMFSATIMMGTTAIVRNKSILNQVRFSKFVYPTTYTIVALYEFFISTVVLLLLIIFSGIPWSWHMLEYFPITIVGLMLTYGVTLVVSHIGVYLIDLRNIIEILMRAFFYFSPVMWVYDTFNFEFVELLRFNPVSVIVVAYRDVLLRQQSANYFHLLLVFIFSVMTIYLGYKLIKNNESDYGKII